MATVKFLYRSKKDNASLTLRISFNHNDKNYRIDADSRILIYSHEELLQNPKLSSKEHWNEYYLPKPIKKEKGKRTTKKSGSIAKPKDIDTINKLNEVKTELGKIEIIILQEFAKINPLEASKEWLQSVIDEYHNPNLNSDIPNTLIEFLDYYLKAHPELKYGTSKKYNTVKSKLLKRRNQFSKVPILLSDINDNFRRQYQEIYSDYNANTITRDLGEIKTLCRYAFTVGKDISKEVLRWKFKLKKTSFVYLNEEEIETIAKAKNLPEYLDNARDWLIISCYIGQRVSDFMRFNKSMIRVEKNKKGKEIHLVEFTQIKTNTTIAVPLHKKVLEILEKRNGDFPRRISDQKYNDYIKDVCEKAELKQKVKGSKMDSETFRKKSGTYEKWELVSSHIGRRSFATNNFGKIPTRLLMSATGHSKEDMFLKYIGKTQTEQAKELADYF